MHDCIIGRNTIKMIPSLHASLTNIRRDILMFAKEIDELEHDLIREDFRVNQTDNQQSTAEEGAIIIFPGFRDSRPPIAISKEAGPPERPDEMAPKSTTSAEVESTRTLIEQELESVTTDSAKDINLSQNQHLKFRIHLVTRDPNHVSCDPPTQDTLTRKLFGAKQDLCQKPSRLWSKKPLCSNSKPA